MVCTVIGERQAHDTGFIVRNTRHVSERCQVPLVQKDSKDCTLGTFARAQHKKQTHTRGQEGKKEEEIKGRQVRKKEEGEIKGRQSTQKARQAVSTSQVGQPAR